MALAGPISGLTQGIISALVFMEFTKQSLFKLFLLWFSVLGFYNFFGYLMTGPMFVNGDIGKIYAILNIPLFVATIVALVGATAILFIASKLSRLFLQFCYQSKWMENKSTRKNFAFITIILPWVFGSTIITLLYLPVVAMVSIIYPVMSGMVFIYPWQNAQRIDDVLPADDEYIGNFSIPLLIILTIIIVVFRFILRSGIPLFA